MNFCFEFDPQKSASNKTKHGIDFIAAQMLWRDFISEDSADFRGEMRYVVTGTIQTKRWTAVVTYRGNVIRIISVRQANTAEIALYEQRLQSKR